MQNFQKQLLQQQQGGSGGPQQIGHGFNQSCENSNNTPGSGGIGGMGVSGGGGGLSKAQARHCYPV